MRAHGLTALRRRGAAHARRLAAHLRPACRGRVASGRAERWRRCCAREEARGLAGLERYRSLQRARWRRPSAALLHLLIGRQAAGQAVAGYGAPGKGNTLLNYCGIRTDFLDFTVDRSPYKQGLFLPGTHIPILAPDEIARRRPDYLVVLPWNFKDEIMAQMAGIKEWGGRFVIPIPEARIVP